MKKIKNDKTLDNSTEFKEAAKKLTRYCEDYECYFSFKRKPVNEAFVIKLAHDLREWSKFDGADGKREAFTIQSFLREKGIGKDDYYRWKDKWSCLKLAHEFALGELGDRRGHGAAVGRYKDGIILRTQGYYSDDFASEQIKASKLKLDSETDSKITVVIPPAVITTEVMKAIAKHKGEQDVE